MNHQIVASQAAAGQRLDLFLTKHLVQFSRAHVQRAIDAGGILVNGLPTKASQRLSAGDLVEIVNLEVPRPGPQPQAIPLEVLCEDEDLAVINKPAGMIVHPARGHWDGTLASAVAHHFAHLSERGGPTRPGIVHRLDRETSGVILIAKNDTTHDALASQFQARSVQKEYLAIVAGVPDRDSDVIDQPIGNHPSQREKMAIRVGHPSSRNAVTYYEVLERFSGYAFLCVRPKTGRTHQIRLHLAHIGCPVLCDRLYGGRTRITNQELGQRGHMPQHQETATILLERHALHAHRLTVHHPRTNEIVSFEAPLPVDMEQTLEALRLI